MIRYLLFLFLIISILTCAVVQEDKNESKKQVKTEQNESK